MSPAIAYGLLVALVALISWASQSVVLQKLGLVMLVVWAASNLIVEFLGFARAPLLLPTTDAILALWVAWIGYFHRSRVALAVFLLFALIAYAHVVAFLTCTEASYSYYLTLNLISLAQLLTIGVPGAWLALRHWTVARRERPRFDLARR